MQQVEIYDIKLSHRGMQQFSPSSWSSWFWKNGGTHFTLFSIFMGFQDLFLNFSMLCCHCWYFFLTLQYYILAVVGIGACYQRSIGRTC